MHLALRNHLLWLPNDEELLSELGRVRLRETGIGQARFDHDAGDHDDQAVALAIIVAELIGNVQTSQARQWLESLAPPCPKSHAALPTLRARLCVAFVTHRLSRPKSLRPMCLSQSPRNRGRRGVRLRQPVTPVPSHAQPQRLSFFSSINNKIIGAAGHSSAAPNTFS